MRAWIVTVPGNRTSEHGAMKCIESHLAHGCEFAIETMRATTPEGVDQQMAHYGLRWVWPEYGETICPVTGLKMRPYKSRNLKARIACFLSHFRMWELCMESGEPLIVCEDDCLWTRTFDPSWVQYTDHGMISLNDPRGATRLAKRYHFNVQHARGREEHDDENEYVHVVNAPWVDDDTLVPQGLPGHSCYLIKPEFAARLMKEARQVGARPNDALAVKQRFPWLLGCAVDYATVVSGRASQLA